jgi:diguanylate cyclase (GGDEF)-like protein
VPFAYVLVLATMVTAALGYLPESMEGVHVNYGKPFIFISLGLLILPARDAYFLVRRRKQLVDPIARNQIVYLFVALGSLVIFLLVTFAPFGGRFPFTHIGNLLTACILTYAVVAHRLLDVNVVFRRALVYSGIYGLSVGTIVLLLRLAQAVSRFTLDVQTLVAALVVGVPVTWLTFSHRVREPWQERVEQSLVGRTYAYRKQLADFVGKIHSFPTLQELGRQMVTLLAQSVDAERAWLLLPESAGGDFVIEFSYPPVEDDESMSSFSLRQDSPILARLRRSSDVVQVQELQTQPEFLGLWQEEKESVESARIRMFIPLVNVGGLVAVLALGRKLQGRRYSVEDMDLLDFVTSRAAGSMEKEHLHDQVQRQSKELALINRLTSLITSNLNIQEIVDAFARELKEVVDVDGLAIALVEDSELRFLALSDRAKSQWEVNQKVPLAGTATEWLVRNKKSVYEPDLAQARRFWTDERNSMIGTRSLLYLPLIVKDRVIGCLAVGSLSPNAYTDSEIQLLEHLALQIAVPIENTQLYARAEQRARIDELTNLFNRRHFEERLKEEVGRHSRYGHMFSLLMVDLDSFKTYNDIYGHLSGDELLKQIGGLIANSVRSTDQAFRYGGDEFVVLLPQTPVDQAQVVADRVRVEVARAMEARDLTVTCSIGLASYPADGAMPAELVTAADTALYYAKSTGGDRVYLSSKVLAEPAPKTGANARSSNLSAVYALVSTVDARDHYTYGHSRKVNTYAVALAEAIGLSVEEVSRISAAALLHDIGKVGIPDRTLSKRGKLTDEEWQAVQSHPRVGANIVGNVPSLVSCVSGVLYHHERWDGTGYPEGLKGEAIPLDARILAIADAYAAMVSSRPYRDAMCEDKALKRMQQGAGRQFDPKLVEVFVRVVSAGGLELADVARERPKQEQEQEPE